MNRHFLSLCISALAIALPSMGHAADQLQAAESQENVQKVEIGNEPGKVTVGSVVQNQSGKGSRQQISIGNTQGKGGSANVTVGSVVQNQKDEAGGSQEVKIGKDAQVGSIIQNGSGTVEVGSP